MIVKDVKGTIFIRIRSATSNFLFHFFMRQSKPCSTPFLADFRSIQHIGSHVLDKKSYQIIISCLVYIKSLIRSDIAYVTNDVPLFLQLPLNDYHTSAKYVH